MYGGLCMQCRVIFVVALATILCGCAQKVWVKPGSTAAEFNQDKAECQMRGQQAEAATIGYNGFLAGYEHAKTAQSCMQARGWTAASKDAAEGMERSRTAWVKDPGYDHDQAVADLANCKKWNPNESGVAGCMEKMGYVRITSGELFDAAKKALATGAVSDSVSSKEEQNARQQKIIHIALSGQ